MKHKNVIRYYVKCNKQFINYKQKNPVNYFLCYFNFLVVKLGLLGIRAVRFLLDSTVSELRFHSFEGVYRKNIVLNNGKGPTLQVTSAIR